LKKSDVIHAWGRILSGQYPSLSVEITRECPLRCPGCYAYEPEHLHQLGPLRTLSDYKGDQLVDGMLDLARRYRPLHISIVGGEPLVRFRELDIILPKLSEMGIAVQLVTSAVREIPKHWPNKIEATVNFNRSFGSKPRFIVQLTDVASKGARVIAQTRGLVKVPK